MPVTAAIIGAAAPVVGGIIGGNQANKERNAANAARAAALAQFSGISLPDIEAMKLNPEMFASAGTLTPEMIQLITQGDTALQDVSIDPRLRQSQMAALDQISGIASTGMSEGDNAAFELARRNSAAEAQAKQGQILQNMAQRGQSGSGAELAASLANAQGSADRQQAAQLEEAKARQQARMAALSQQANMASSVRGADYSEQSNLANARDAISRFNAQNSQNVGMQNTGAKNSAQASNLQNDQNIRNQNTTASNMAQANNKGLYQTQFQNQMNLAGAKANALTGNANAADQRAGQTAGMWAGIGQGVGTAINAYANKPAATAGSNTQSLPTFNPATGKYE